MHLQRWTYSGGARAGSNTPNSEARPAGGAASRKLPCYHVRISHVPNSSACMHKTFTLPRLDHSPQAYTDKWASPPLWPQIAGNPNDPDSQASMLCALQVEGGLARPDHWRFCSARCFKLSAGGISRLQHRAGSAADRLGRGGAAGFDHDNL